MNKVLSIIVVAVVAFSAHAAQQPADNTVDADRLRAAQEKLAAKDAAKRAERDRKVEITQGELDDLRERIKQLEGELAALKGGKPAATAGPKRNPTEIEVGMTRAEVERFVKSKLGAFRLTPDRSSMRGDVKVETIRVEKVGKASVAAGRGTNSLGQNRTTNETREVVESSLLVTLENGVVTAIR